MCLLALTLPRSLTAQVAKGYVMKDMVLVSYPTDAQVTKAVFDFRKDPRFVGSVSVLMPTPLAHGSYVVFKSNGQWRSLFTSEVSNITLDRSKKQMFLFMGPPYANFANQQEAAKFAAEQQQKGWTTNLVATGAGYGRWNVILSSQQLTVGTWQMPWVQ
jgi:hypothetical protein